MRCVRHVFTLAILLFLCCSIASSVDNQADQRVGFLTVTVSIGDGHTPLKSAFVLVRGYRPVYKGESAVALKQSMYGYFETSVPPGIYDVFVSDPSAIPSCKRVAIVAGQVEHYGVNFRVDEKHLEK